MIDQNVVAISFLVALAAVTHFSIHRIDEGHVGVYFRVSISIQTFFLPFSVIASSFEHEINNLR